MGLITRRSILRSLFAAPVIVAASSLMPIRGLIMPAELSAAEMIALLDRRLDEGAGVFNFQTGLWQSDRYEQGPARHYVRCGGYQSFCPGDSGYTGDGIHTHSAFADGELVKRLKATIQ